MSDEEEIKPRTMRRRVRPAEETTTEDPSVEDAPPADDEDDEDDGGLQRATASDIHGGWTAAQKEMDATSTFAQALKLEQNVQIIKFMQDEPYANFRRHWVDRNGPQGKTTRAHVCLATVGKDCPLCDIGDRPQAVSAFNVVIIGDDGQVILKSWDVGARIFNVLKAFATDPKVGPLTKGYYAVSATGKKGSKQTNVIPIGANRLKEDYDVDPPSDKELDSVELYDVTVITIPKTSELREIATELAEDD